MMPLDIGSGGGNCSCLSAYAAAKFSRANRIAVMPIATVVSRAIAAIHFSMSVDFPRLAWSLLRERPPRRQRGCEAVSAADRFWLHRFFIVSGYRRKLSYICGERG
jgi:hypothetical protein